MPTSFAARKRSILEQLEIPDAEYTDASPKGSIDEGIRQLVDNINGLKGFVTTSSCAGRVAVYLEGRAKAAKQHDNDVGTQAHIASTPDDSQGTLQAGGKGGGEWLFVSHEPVRLEVYSEPNALASLLGLPSKSAANIHIDPAGSRFVHFKFEPMVSFEGLDACLLLSQLSSISCQ